ncbi:zinc finger protein 507 [Electrophorus electricus]|uniref:zinc finger protein 507 n=1 Tax=Electrophorus electricus TaxID=8005 RepID=UPI0015D02DC4|nr:zinc finger protein 507 [Electrophorus electricus]XP_035376788.1 zinc finger protein 507 [Electrophorus electricus]
MEDSRGAAVLVPHLRDQQEAVFIPEPHHPGGEDQRRQPRKPAADSLIQVIKKLSKIVEKRPRRCPVPGRKRPSTPCASVMAADSRDRDEGVPLGKRPREQGEESHGSRLGLEPPSAGSRTVTCYQCSLCHFLSPTLRALKEHLTQHDEQHSDLILICSECRFASRHKEELEAHVRLHLQEGERGQGRTGHPAVKSDAEPEGLPPASGKKWYSYEHGRYRCLICSYECGQQRNLKTHAWKHAGLVDCSYPVFEDEVARGEAHGPIHGAVASSPPLVPVKEGEAIVVLAPGGEQAHVLHSTPSLQLELCAQAGVQCDSELAEGRGEELGGEASIDASSGKDASVSDEPAVEVQVTPEAQVELELELETESGPGSSDSLLSSAQKIISRCSNGVGHVNVIVERLPCSEQPVASQPLLLSAEVAGDKTLLAPEEVHPESQPCPAFYEEQELVIGWNHDGEPGGEEGASTPPPDENVPPARRRTHSECLRLHSLAAEALVTMPMRATELSEAIIRGASGLGAPIPDTGQRVVELPGSATPPKGVPGPATLLNLSLDVPPGSRDDALTEGPSKAGISMSLLTVIERLRERSDQDASDEDILKELQDNAQSHGDGGGSGWAGPVAVGGTGDPASTEGGLVEYIAGSDRPYRCRLCLYSSGNKGYIKQHLRVHRQRRPYQCPICEHIACSSKDLENHMIHHCKTRMYQCKNCSETFHYKNQLRSHERDSHEAGDNVAASPPVTETAASTDKGEKMLDEDLASEQKVFKCDVCDYTSSTYVGVRNHRRIHNSDKPYRCCSCDFATTNMNSLKSHMRRHPQEHQAVQLLEQYRCSLCGYVCSHPPSLKSHMWKHAGDQNYNYEQVNRAINEAISQSSRSPKPAAEPAVERPCLILGKKEKTPPEPAPGAAGDSPRAGPGDGPTWSPGRRAGTGQAARAEYCVLLFCCCICGFESTNKDQLMEHMKEHEGDIISIILSKDQQGSHAAEATTVQ